MNPWPVVERVERAAEGHRVARAVIYGTAIGAGVVTGLGYVGVRWVQGLWDQFTGSRA